MNFKAQTPAKGEIAKNGEIFFRNPLDAPRELGSMAKFANAESLAYSGDRMLEHVFRKNRYADMDTPLSKYCFPLGFGLDAHIKKLLDAKGGKGVLRALDVGAGTCSQWKEIVLENKGKIEFSAVVLSDIYADGAMKQHLKICAAAGMAHEFPPEHFDLIVSYAGIHAQGLAGIKASEWLLKSGGEMIITLNAKTMPAPDEILSVCSQLELVQAASDRSSKAVAYWMRKLD
ncbi:MAG: hypothetical protein NTV88_05685 [Candidatus Micrarchaeota archaeon]|nr:hypothetical protein [Candidatus Micrarchaeota archaeon]